MSGVGAAARHALSRVALHPYTLRRTLHEGAPCDSQLQLEHLEIQACSPLALPALKMQLVELCTSHARTAGLSF